MCSNINTRFRNEGIKDLCWAVGVAVDEPLFREVFNCITAICPKAAAYLLRLGRDKWTMAFDEGRRYGTTTTNYVETFNGVLKGARRLPICAIVEMTYVKITDYFNEKLALDRQLKAGVRPWTPYAENIHRRNARFADRNIVHMVNKDDLLVNVRSVGPDGYVTRFAVTLTTNQFSCGSWNNSRIPCSHPIQVYKQNDIPAFNFMPWYYEVDHFIENTVVSSIRYRQKNTDLQQDSS